MEHGNIGTQLISWPQEHVVKCLVFFHPEDAHGLRLEQEQKIAEVYHACCQSGHELLLEVILPASMPRSDELYLRAISRFYNLAFTRTGGKLPPLSAERLDGTERDYRTP
jgi:5-dehydro-2-deoxygluconokinase